MRPLFGCFGGAVPACPGDRGWIEWFYTALLNDVVETTGFTVPEGVWCLKVGDFDLEVYEGPDRPWIGLDAVGIDLALMGFAPHEADYDEEDETYIALKAAWERLRIAAREAGIELPEGGLFVELGG